MLSLKPTLQSQVVAKMNDCIGNLQQTKADLRKDDVCTFVSNALMQKQAMQGCTIAALRWPLPYPLLGCLFFCQGTILLGLRGKGTRS